MGKRIESENTEFGDMFVNESIVNKRKLEQKENMFGY